MNNDLISRSALLERIDMEREYLKARGLLGAEHILVHNFRELVEEAPACGNLIDKDQFFSDFPELAIEPYINVPVVGSQDKGDQ